MKMSYLWILLLLPAMAQAQPQAHKKWGVYAGMNVFFGNSGIATMDDYQFYVLPTNDWYSFTGNIYFNAGLNYESFQLGKNWSLSHALGYSENLMSLGVYERNSFDPNSWMYSRQAYHFREVNWANTLSNRVGNLSFGAGFVTTYRKMANDRDYLFSISAYLPQSFRAWVLKGAVTATYHMGRFATTLEFNRNITPYTDKFFYNDQLVQFRSWGDQYLLYFSYKIF